MNELIPLIKAYFETKSRLNEIRLAIFGMFPSRIREERMKKELTQDDLAQDWGVGVPYISKLENGANVPSEKVMKHVLEWENLEE